MSKLAKKKAVKNSLIIPRRLAHCCPKALTLIISKRFVMKKIFLTLGAFLAFTTAMYAQETKKSQPLATPADSISEVQTPSDKAARQANVNAQNNRNIRAADDKLRTETERSTGKEMKNPATTNPTTVKPPVLSDPTTAPINSGNR